jgi:hypothetical protein
MPVLLFSFALSTSHAQTDTTDRFGWKQIANDLEVFIDRLEFKDGAYEKWEAIPNLRQLAAIDAWVAFAVPFMESLMPTIDDEQIRDDAMTYTGFLNGNTESAEKWTALSETRKNAMFDIRNKLEIEALKILIERFRGN